MEDTRDTDFVTFEIWVSVLAALLLSLDHRMDFGLVHNIAKLEFVFYVNSDVSPLLE